MNIRTMAVQINNENWPVAVACLGGRFAATPFSEVNGAYLVINEIEQQFGFVRQYGGRRYPNREITLSNNWYPAEAFKQVYGFDKRKNHGQFFEVHRIAGDEVLYHEPGEDLDDTSD